MTGQIRSEFRKMLTVRSTYYLGGGASAIALLAALGSGAGQTIDSAMPLAEQQSYFVTSLLTRLVFVLVGIRVVTEEYRYGTMTPSLLAAGSRMRLLGAKVVAASLVAAGMAALAGLTLVVALTALGEGSGTAVTAGDGAVLAGMVGSAALFAALGVAMGTLIRQPVPVTVGAVVWLLAVEDLLQVQFGQAVEYLPGYAGLTMAGAEQVTSVTPAVGAVVLLGWAAAALVPAAAWLQRRDVG